jgi:hypothetical protein
MQAKRKELLHPKKRKRRRTLVKKAKRTPRLRKRKKRENAKRNKSALSVSRSALKRWSATLTKLLSYVNLEEESLIFTRMIPNVKHNIMIGWFQCFSEMLRNQVQQTLRKLSWKSEPLQLQEHLFHKRKLWTLEKFLWLSGKLMRY